VEELKPVHTWQIPSFLHETNAPDKSADVQINHIGDVGK